MLKIDTHAHWFPPQWLDLLAAEGNGNGAEVSRNAEGDVDSARRATAVARSSASSTSRFRSA